MRAHPLCWRPGAAACCCWHCPAPGGIRHSEVGYSQHVRQDLHLRYGKGQHPNVIIHEGGLPDYGERIKGAKYCRAPSGHGWGIRLGQYMTLGCVPVIIQVRAAAGWAGRCGPAAIVLVAGAVVGAPVHAVSARCRESRGVA